MKHEMTPQALTEELGLLMGKARRRFWILASRKFEASGESFTLWRVLSQLARVERSTQHDLATAVGQDPPSISRLLDALERDQLVRRDRDQEDRRRVYVQLTRRGRAQCERMRPALREAIDRCFQPLSHDERGVLREILAKLVADEPSTCESTPSQE